MLLLTTLLSQKTWSRNLWPCFWPVAPFDPSTACRTLNEQEILLSSGNLKCEISVVGKPWSRLPRTNLVNLRRRGGPHARQQRWNLQSNHAWELSADAAACHSQLGAVQIGRPRLHCWERGGHWIQQIPLVRSAIVSTKSWPYKGDTLLITQKQLGPSLISGNSLTCIRRPYMRDLLYPKSASDHCKTFCILRANRRLYIWTAPPISPSWFVEVTTQTKNWAFTDLSAHQTINWHNKHIWSVVMAGIIAWSSELQQEESF